MRTEINVFETLFVEDDFNPKKLHVLQVDCLMVMCLTCLNLALKDLYP